MKNTRGSTGVIAPGVIRLGNRFVNWWLITTAEGVVVVDAGLPGHLAHLERCLGDRGLSLQDVDACLLTHADIDHIGVAEARYAPCGAGRTSSRSCAGPASCATRSGGWCALRRMPRIPGSEHEPRLGPASKSSSLGSHQRPRMR